jgi:hypothetical protein
MCTWYYWFAGLRVAATPSDSSSGGDFDAVLAQMADKVRSVFKKLLGLCSNIYCTFRCGAGSCIAMTCHATCFTACSSVVRRQQNEILKGLSSCPAAQFEKAENKPAVVGYLSGAVLAVFFTEWLIHLPGLNVVCVC